MTDLIEALRTAAPRLNKRVLDAMYRDPFWMDRYGERGRGHASEDGNFHIKYLVSALEVDDPSLFATYARWLRDVLVARGMCSRHLVENFEHLADAIADEPWPGRERVVAILRGGIAGLDYAAGDAAFVDQRRDAWCAELAAPHAVHALSYLADALATNRSTAAFGDYAPPALRSQLAALPDMPPTARAILEESR